MTPDVLAEAHLLRQLKGKKAVIKFLLHADSKISEPLKITLGKPKQKRAKPGKQGAKPGKKPA